ncbi:trypsin I-P1-like [Carettochelys insculpta]|uniref:trypsin I-P1-like n=1 Tax=Carettochelys insculpta TaxID=44489 RepID=UPI003EB86889
MLTGEKSPVDSLIPYNTLAQDIPRVLRGFQCQHHSQPWIVALFHGLHFRCTGTLIGKQWVVTAASCNTGYPLHVRLGEQNLFHIDWSEQLRISSRVIQHPEYNSKTNRNNIMLVKLLLPATINKYVQLLQLPSNPPAANLTCVLPGWGTNAFHNVPRTPGRSKPLCKHAPLHSDVLFCGNITTLADDQCRNTNPEHITKNMLCAGVIHGGTDFCQGDPGSPLICQEVLQGIASWGFEGCSLAEWTGVFVKVYNYVSWLEKTMKSG